MSLSIWLRSSSTVGIAVWRPANSSLRRVGMDVNTAVGRLVAKGKPGEARASSADIA
jgi:hypothetical protein